MAEKWGGARGAPPVKECILGWRGSWGPATARQGDRTRHVLLGPMRGLEGPGASSSGFPKKIHAPPFVFAAQTHSNREFPGRLLPRGSLQHRDHAFLLDRGFFWTGWSGRGRALMLDHSSSRQGRRRGRAGFLALFDIRAGRSTAPSKTALPLRWAPCNSSFERRQSRLIHLPPALRAEGNFHYYQ